MAVPIKIPDIGTTVEEVAVYSWLVEEGDTIARDFQKIVDEYVRRRYGAGGAAAATASKTISTKAAV